jgi:siroheme synthase
MGLSHHEQIISRLHAHGAPQSRAAAIVEQGTRAEQRVVTGTLADLVHKAGEARIQSPALLIVGDVVRLHDALQWFNTVAGDRQAVPLFALSNEVRLTA